MVKEKVVIIFNAFEKNKQDYTLDEWVRALRCVKETTVMEFIKNNKVSTLNDLTHGLFKGDYETIAEMNGYNNIEAYTRDLNKIKAELAGKEKQ